MRPLIVAVCLLSLPVIALAGAPFTWTNAGEIPGFEAAYGELDATFHDGVLHVVTSKSGREILHVQRVDDQWTAPVFLAHHHSGTTPVLAVCDGTLHMVANPGDFKLAHSIWDGRAWSEAVTIPGWEARRRGAFTGFDGVLHYAHGGMNQDRKRIFYASNAGWGWGDDQAVPDQASRTTVAMAGLDGTLHMIHVAKNSPTLWHATREQWGEWTTPVQIPGVETSRVPALVEANNRLYAFFTTGTARLGEQAPVAYCVLEDGRWQAPVTIEGYVCYGMPAVAVEPGLPEQIHLLLPSRVGVLHLHTELEVKLAPVKAKTVRMAR